MCGIAGIAGLHPEDRRARVTRMVEALAHRGPDGRGFFEAPRLTLGHTRLAILDLSSAGQQPMADGPNVIVFNGEIYNHGELRRRLPVDRWRSRADTETLLKAYRSYGADVVYHLAGMFAYAIWDASRQAIVCARDSSQRPRPSRRPATAWPPSCSR